MRYLGKVVELSDGSRVFCTWDEVYNLSGCVHEDFLYDNTGECLAHLTEALEAKEKQNEQ